jgi:hypothetical protein
MKSILSKIFLLTIILIILSEVTSMVLDLKVLLYNSLSEQLTPKQLSHYFEFQDKWRWVSYILIFIFIVVKTIVITSILYVGIFGFIFFRQITN